MEDIIDVSTTQTYIEKIYDMVIAYAPKFLLAVIVLFIGLRIIKFITRLAGKGLKKREVDPTLAPFAVNLLDWGLKIMLVISVAAMLGVETTSFIAVLGAMGLAVGLALQGTLSNFAGGVLIMVFKPYRVEDLIEAQGQIGTVKEIQIFNTILASPQNKMIIIPNGAIMNGEIINYTILGKIRVDLTVGISYEADIEEAKQVLTLEMANHPLVLGDPAPFVGVSALADSSVNLAVRPYCEPKDYWTVYFDILEGSKLALDKNNITIPFPQVDVHMKNTK
ncbi:MAG: mechanosensitive ion channel [Cytophagales bacterium]|nr:mechanosensitive ion channel [Cytophagales bacterium]